MTSILPHQGARSIGQEDVAPGMTSFGLVATAVVAFEAATVAEAVGLLACEQNKTSFGRNLMNSGWVDREQAKVQENQVDGFKD